MPKLIKPNRSRRAVATETPRARAERAFAEEYRRLLPKASAYAQRKLPREDAEDVVQDAFVTLWEVCYADDELPKVPVSGLLFEILRRRIIDELRHLEAARERDEQHVIDIRDRLEPRLSASRVADGNLLAARIEYIVECLPERSRRVYQIAMAPNGSTRQAAQQLGIPYNTARWLLAESKRHLADTLTRDGYDVPGFDPDGPSVGRTQ